MLIPLTIQNIISVSVNLADNFMLGAYSQSAMSGVSLANQVQFVLQMLVVGISEGVVVLCAQYWGKRNIGAMKSIIGLGIKAEILLGIIFCIISFAFSYNLVGLMTPIQEVIYEGSNYLKIWSFSCFFFSATVLLLASMRCVENMRIGMWVSISALVVNVVLNYLFIYGNFGFPEMGVQGAALATLISRVIEFSIILSYVLFIDKKLSIKIREILRIDFTYLKDYIKYGSPLIISGFLWSLGSFCQASILGRLTADVIAANSIAMTLFQVVSVASYASAGVASVITGKTIGQGEFDNVKAYAITMQVLFLGLGVLGCISLLSIKGMLLDLYQISEASKQLANQLWWYFL